MMNIMKKIKGIFGKYETGYEYWVKFNEIKIQPCFNNSHPSYRKMIQKWNYYRETGNFQSPIVLNKDFVLVDGYTSYIIAEKESMRKIPAWFVD